MSSLMIAMFEKRQRRKFTLNPFMDGTLESRGVTFYDARQRATPDTDTEMSSDDSSSASSASMQSEDRARAPAPISTVGDLDLGQYADLVESVESRPGGLALGLGLAERDVEMGMEGGGTPTGQRCTGAGNQQTPEGPVETSTSTKGAGDQMMNQYIDWAAHSDEDDPAPAPATTANNPDPDSEDSSLMSSIASSSQKTQAPTPDTPSTTVTTPDISSNSIDPLKPVIWGNSNNVATTTRTIISFETEEETRAVMLTMDNGMGMDMDMDTDPILFDEANSPEPWDARPSSTPSLPSPYSLCPSSSSSESSESQPYIAPMPHITKRLSQVQQRRRQNGHPFFRHRVYRRSPLSRETILVPEESGVGSDMAWYMHDGKGVLQDAEPGRVEVWRRCEKCRGRCRWESVAEGIPEEEVLTDTEEEILSLGG